MQKSLPEEFNETATAAYEAFPQKLKKLVVLLVPDSDTPVYVSPEMAEKLTKDTAKIKWSVREVTNVMGARGFAGYASKHFFLSNTRVNLIALHTNLHGNYSDRYTKEMHLTFNLDHEIGHHILKKTHHFFSTSTQHKESASDAFAMLRHIQHFGKNTDHAGAYGEDRAGFIVLRADPDHYTTDAIEKAILVSEQMDISGLSLRETAALAEKIAAECHLNHKTLKKIRNAFRPVSASYKTHTGNDAYDVACRETLSVMREHRDDPDIFKAGKRALSYPTIKNFMTESAKTDSYWQEALDFIDKRQPKVLANPARRNPLKFMTKIFAH